MGGARTPTAKPSPHRSSSNCAKKTMEINNLWDLRVLESSSSVLLKIPNDVSVSSIIPNYMRRYIQDYAPMGGRMTLRIGLLIDRLNDSGRYFVIRLSVNMPMSRPTNCYCKKTCPSLLNLVKLCASPLCHWSAAWSMIIYLFWRLLQSQSNYRKHVAKLNARSSRQFWQSLRTYYWTGYSPFCGHCWICSSCCLWQTSVHVWVGCKSGKNYKLLQYFTCCAIIQSRV